MKYLKLIAILVITMSQSYAQDKGLKTFKDDNFSIDYPINWTVTNDNGIRNFFPEDQHGAVTISKYTNIDFPLEKTKQFILEMNDVKDNPDNVVMVKKGNYTEFTYEHIDQVDKIKWVTKAIRKDNDFYLLTINCELSKWNNSRVIFLNVLESFRIK